MWAGWSKVWFPAWAEDFSVFKNVQIGSGTHPASYSIVVSFSMSTTVPCHGKDSDNCMFISSDLLSLTIAVIISHTMLYILRSWWHVLAIIRSLTLQHAEKINNNWKIWNINVQIIFTFISFLSADQISFLLQMMFQYFANISCKSSCLHRALMIIKHFIIQIMHNIYRYNQNYYIFKSAPACFRSQRIHHQGALYSAWL